MNSLPVRILAAVLTFILGVGLANLWLTTPSINPVACRFPVGTRPAQLEMVFVIDTTGSMGGLLEAAKQRIWGIVNGVIREHGSSVRIGLVAYRDRGDAYVTQVLPLTEDLDKVYMTLMDYQAAGGGDAPEDVRTALAESLNKIPWSDGELGVSRIIFLVGDAPPHDYPDVPDTLTTAANAAKKGIIVNTIQCGSAGETTRAWEAIASSGKGQYFAIPSDGGVQAIETPYDDQLSELARKLGATLLPYGFGGEAQQSEVVARAQLIEARVASSAPSAAKAERAINKAISSDAYIGDLLQQIENGSVKLETMDQDQLPADLRKMTSSEQRQEIERRLAIRSDLRHQILLLSKQRDAFIEAERKKSASDGFDVVVAKALEEQMSRRAIK
ncbi:MAG TPA: vWA domain-containing protein [Pyrinomonadaceae bacterium]